MFATAYFITLFFCFIPNNAMIKIWLTKLFFLNCWVPVANPPRMYRSLQAYCTMRKFQLAPPGVLHVTMTPATLTMKGGTIGREIAGKFGLKVAS
jgi:hypothetical protein